MMTVIGKDKNVVNKFYIDKVTFSQITGEYHGYFFLFIEEN